MKLSKHKRIRSYILSGKALTPMMALRRFGSYRLASIINRLREEGINIRTTIEYDNGNQYAVYQLGERI